VDGYCSSGGHPGTPGRRRPVRWTACRLRRAALPVRRASRAVGVRAPTIPGPGPARAPSSTAGGVRRAERASRDGGVDGPRRGGEVGHDRRADEHVERQGVEVAPPGRNGRRVDVSAGVVPSARRETSAGSPAATRATGSTTTGGSPGQHRRVGADRPRDIDDHHRGHTPHPRAAVLAVVREGAGHGTNRTGRSKMRCRCHTLRLGSWSSGPPRDRPPFRSPPSQRRLVRGPVRARGGRGCHRSVENAV